MREDADRRGHELAAGVNYYFRGHALKLQTDWVARLPAFGDFSSADHAFHVIFDASF